MAKKKTNNNNQRNNPGSKNQRLFYFALLAAMGHLPNRKASSKALRDSIIDLLVAQGDELNADPEFPDSFWSVLIPICRGKQMRDKEIKQLVLRVRKIELTNPKGGILEELDQREGFFNNVGDVFTSLFDEDPDTTLLGSIGDLISDIF